MNINISMIEHGDEAEINKIVELSGSFVDECKLFKTLCFNPEKCRKYAECVQSVGRILIAYVDNTPAGYAAVVSDDSMTDKPRLEMVTFYVHPAFRNTGVGAALADKVVDLIDTLGNGYSQLSICSYFEKDQELIQRATELLFKRRGFKQVGVILGKMGEGQ